MQKRIVILAPRLSQAENFYKAYLVGICERMPMFVGFDDLRRLRGLRNAIIFIIAPMSVIIDREMQAYLVGNKMIFVSDWR